MNKEHFADILRSCAAELPLPELIGKKSPELLAKAGLPHLHSGWELRYDGQRFSLVPPQVVHDSLPVRVFSLEVSMTYLAAAQVGDKFFFSRQLASDASGVHFALELFAQLQSENLSESGRRYLFAAALEMLASAIADSDEGVDSRPNLEVASSILGYLEKYHYRRSLTLTDLSVYFGLTEQYLNRKFRQKYGCSIHAKLIDIRLRRAAELLERGDYLVRDIARMTGWHSVFYFGNIFRKRYGISPGRFAAGSNDRQTSKKNKHTQSNP